MRPLHMIAVLVCLITASFSLAQDVDVKQMKKAAILPFSFTEKDKHGVVAVKPDREPIQKVRYALGEMLKKANCLVVDDLLAPAMFKTLTGKEFIVPVEKLPDPKVLLNIGKKLGVHYVITGSVHWDIRTKWVGIGLKTKAYAHAEVIVIDVVKGEVALRAIEDRDSTKKDQALEVLAAIFVNIGATAISGGPKTPHMNASGVSSVGIALLPWVQSMDNTLNKKIK